MKLECIRIVIVPFSLTAMRRELRLYTGWFNEHRPHAALDGRTPRKVHQVRKRSAPSIEPRPRWPSRRRRHVAHGHRVRLDVGFLENRKHLPVIALRRAA
jgi:hypothetical protein